jgi:hypothetical protein
MEQPSSALPKLINLSEAARRLGYQSTGPIKKLISDNKLAPYKLPDTNRIMVDLFETTATAGDIGGAQYLRVRARTK